MFDAIVRDCRHACRALLKRRAHALVVIVTIALVIGAASAVVAVVLATMVRPLPFPESDRLVQVFTMPPGRTTLAIATRSTTACSSAFATRCACRGLRRHLGPRPRTGQRRRPAGKRDGRRRVAGYLRALRWAADPGPHLHGRRGSRRREAHRAEPWPVAAAIRRRPGDHWAHGVDRSRPAPRCRRHAAVVPRGLQRRPSSGRRCTPQKPGSPRSPPSSRRSRGSTPTATVAQLESELEARMQGSSPRRRRR